MKYFFMCLVVLMPSVAHAKWTCPGGSGPFVVNGVGYDVTNYQPRIHFKDQGKDDWAYLSYNYGVNKDYGKAILSVALTAYATKAKLMIRCSSNDVGGLWISDDGGISPD